jgi:hypothetical protein
MGHHHPDIVVVVVVESITRATSDRRYGCTLVLLQEGQHRIDRFCGQQVVHVDISACDPAREMTLDRAYREAANRRDLLCRLALPVQIECVFEDAALRLATGGNGAGHLRAGERQAEH